MAQTVKRLSTMQETRVRSLGREDPMEKEMAIHSCTIAWKIPRTEEPGRLQSMGSQRVGHNWATSLSLIYCSFRGMGELKSFTVRHLNVGRRNKNVGQGFLDWLTNKLTLESSLLVVSETHSTSSGDLMNILWCVKLLSRVWLFATPWTLAYQAPLSMGFSKQ